MQNFPLANLKLTEATSLTLVGQLVQIGPDGFRPDWFDSVGILSFSVSLAVNAILTGLLVFKIAKASLALRHTHARGIQDFTPLISMLIESGIVFFLVQLIYVICFSLESSAFNLISGPIIMVYVRPLFTFYLLLFRLIVFFKGIIPTTIVVRVALAGTANKSGSQRTTEESAMEFASTMETLPAKIISSPGESKETVV